MRPRTSTRPKPRSARNGRPSQRACWWLAPGCWTRAETRPALGRAPGDLQRRQQVALDEGVRLMPWTERDGKALVKASKDAPPGASAVRLLDYGAAQMFPDGGGVERVHTIARVFDKKGIAKFGEAHIPADAQVVRLHTLKADG